MLKHLFILLAFIGGVSTVRNSAISSRGRAGVAISASTVPARASRYPVIVHIVSREQTITISAGPRGPLYSLSRRSDGRVMIADVDGPTFARLRPDLYRQVRGNVSARNDDRAATGDAAEAPLVMDASIN